MGELALTAVRARHGDALMLTHERTRVLIDGGAHRVYRTFLRPYLATLSGEQGQPPSIDLMMVSHIDSDHIAGVLDLVDELEEADVDRERPLVTIEEVWHNSFADLLAEEGTTRRGTAREQAMTLADMSASDALVAELLPDATDVLASVGQGRRLRHALARLNVDVNRGFADGAVLAGGRAQPWECGGLTLDVVGPTGPELDALRKKWKKALPKLLAKEREREARVAAASLDRSVFNLSSLVVVARADDRRMLLTGDARGDAILERLPGTRDGGVEHFDAVKLPHHGSDRNVTTEFFERVTADRYLISGDGRHGNPEPATFEMLFTARPALDYTIHLTYGVDELAAHDQFDAAGFERVLDRAPGRRECLRFPATDDTTITLRCP